MKADDRGTTPPMMVLSYEPYSDAVFMIGTTLAGMNRIAAAISSAQVTA